MSTVQIISIVVALLFSIQVIILTSKNKLRDQQAFFWIIVAISTFGVSLIIPSINKLATYLGISYMPSLIFLFAFMVVLSILLYQTIVASEQQYKIKKLTQEISYLKYNIKELKQIKNEED